VLVSCVDRGPGALTDLLRALRPARAALLCVRSIAAANRSRWLSSELLGGQTGRTSVYARDGTPCALYRGRVALAPRRPASSGVRQACSLSAALSGTPAGPRSTCSSIRLGGRVRHGRDRRAADRWAGTCSGGLLLMLAAGRQPSPRTRLAASSTYSHARERL